MASDAPLAPDFIHFLFSSKPKFDCYFEVGNRSQGKLERIGAVKLMLMAHSEVFRLELEDSDLKVKGDVPVKDVHPDTFKGMLKYVYGHDTTSDLCFDEADNLLYVAEKYMMKTLKDRLAVRLMKLLNPDNICSLLNNPACYKHLELNSAITEILRYETDHVLASPQFLWMNADGFLKILEQDGLAVPEIELWRAAIKWAKHRANSEDGQLLHQQLSGLTQHLRLCSLNKKEFGEKVMSTDVLTSEEISAICRSICRKEQPQDVGNFSNETEPRKILQREKTVPDELVQTNLNNNELALPDLCKDKWYSEREYNWTMLTKRNTIELLPLVCRSRDRDSMNPERWTYKVNCTITITEVVNQYDPDDSSTIEPSVTLTFSENVKCGVEFGIPLAVGGRNVTLQPDTKYSVRMELNGDHLLYCSNIRGSFENYHLTLAIPSNYYGYHCFPSTKFQYRVATVK